MKTADFNKCYTAAQGRNIETDDWFNCAGFFWLGLTEHQLHKMCQLLKAQGCRTVTRDGAVWFELQSGLRLKNV